MRSALETSIDELVDAAMHVGAGNYGTEDVERLRAEILDTRAPDWMVYAGCALWFLAGMAVSWAMAGVVVGGLIRALTC